MNSNDKNKQDKEDRKKAQGWVMGSTQLYTKNSRKLRNAESRGKSFWGRKHQFNSDWSSLKTYIDRD